MAGLTDEYAARSWYRKWGDPKDDTYLSLEEINTALTLLDALKEHTAPDGELQAFLGLHPPSIFAYANNITKEIMRTAGTRYNPMEQMSVQWLDGLMVGICLAVVLAADD